MADRFSELQMLRLVEAYKEHECLWNYNSELYKSREARVNAYRKIWEKLNIPSISIKDVPRKIKNMRTSYYQELKRIEKSMQAGASPGSVYTPKVSWFTTADGFLKPFRVKLDSYSNMHHEETEKDGDEVEEWVQMTNPKDVLLNDSNCGEPSCSENDEFGETVETRKRKIVNDTRCSKRVKTQDFESGVFCQTLKDLSSQLTEVLSTQVDCFDTFSRYIASLMRSLPLQRALTLQSKIVEMITSAGIEECNGETSRKSNS